MSKCTAAQAVARAQYYLGYKEKSSAKYISSNAKTYFTMDAGSNNYTWFNYLWGVTSASLPVDSRSWCALFVSTVLYEAAGNDKTAAKEMMHGILPYSVVNQVYDAAPSSYKGKSKAHGGSWTPKPGDIIVFCRSKTDEYRTHTGLIEKVVGSIIYTIEGNASNSVQELTYAETYEQIYGFVRPLYSDASTSTTTTKTAKATITLPYVGTGYTADAAYIKTAQILLNGKGAKLDVDGECGDLTIAEIKKYAASDGVLGPNGWAKLLGG